ncbi:hypothetical protein KAR91_47685 [Candidatus Pacearchaeota archaeon]|nr:hypothetical protein [Candidatus Pacearchaeota archaeon]
MWLDAFTHCHENGMNGLVRTCWPDGESYMEQENLVVVMFGIIRDEKGKMKDG